jgi:hypothetical protein
VPQVKAALDEIGNGKELPTIFLERLLGASYLWHALDARDLLKAVSGASLPIRNLTAERQVAQPEASPQLIERR